MGLPHRSSPLRRSWRHAAGGDRDESGSTKKKPGAAPHQGWSVKTMMLPVESKLSLLVSIGEECDQDRLH